LSQSFEFIWLWVPHVYSSSLFLRNSRQKSNSSKTMVSSTTAPGSSGEDHVFERQISQSDSTGTTPQFAGPEFNHLGTEHATIPDLLLNDSEWEKMDALVTQSAIYPITSSDLGMFRETYRKHCQVMAPFI
jgi:hypothetical protein